MAHQAYEMLIFTDSKENNNKFYELILQEDGNTILAKWGRVGSTGQSKTSSGGKYEFDRTIASKIAKGYVKSKTVSITTGKSTDSAALAEAAKRDLIGHRALDKNTALLVKLVERLTEMNRHQIVAASNGNIKIDDTGLITTPLGLVTASTIDEARVLLANIEKSVARKSFSTKTYVESLENYLRLIPQKVPSKRGWGDIFFTEFSSLTAQNSLLDQLEGSLDLYKQKEQDILKKLADGSKIADKVFSTNLELVEDPAVFKKLEKFYNDNKNSRHISAHLKLKNVFALKNEEFEKRFAEKSKKIGNIRQLWHGTRAFNVLSIFKNGLIIPKGGNFHITGRMFGDGVYFSDQSTKSLNYSYGYWGGGKVEENCFMLVADVAMGKEYVPSTYNQSFPVKGYDSVFAQANKSGVMNNEMIVYDLAQVNLRYLCEFSAK
jgi:poly [ADP-ribose] polymerase 2/3/4